ncbi:T9SS type B sorting domain-containing protein [uncultured Algibacter sp.]|uniref:T9SS type B sorting domain-containing protein n=1 Tax=uncultured Algibacter sp. TaxID=298659 RepID=UPI003216C504
MKKLILLFCYFTFTFIGAQNEASNWYFGQNAGIKFNLDGSVTELTDGKLSTDEGCTTISDTNGNLLFYTDGITVWDRLHRPMPNANGALGRGLFGDPSSTQSAIVIPKPKDSNIYYIFTVDTPFIQDADRGFNYSIVDMTLNGSFGDVTSKNMSLLLDSSEKITSVVKDCNSQTLWVITFGPSGGLPARIPVFNTFFAYEVSETGINTTPVISTFNDLNVTDARGYLKLSPDGTKLACANVNSGLYLYDFDVNTGIVSNQERISINFSTPNKPQSPYGLEFSQNNTLLYVSTYYDPQTDFEFFDIASQYGALLQYDLTTTNISSSEVIIDDRQMYRGGLQLGANGKIYRAMSRTYQIGLPFLSVINNPNLTGLSCNYEHNAVKLTKNSRQGLPPFISSFFAQKIDIIGNEGASTQLQLCDGDQFRLAAENTLGATYQWSFNGTPLSNSRYFLDINKPGLYNVFIDLNTGDCNETFEGVANITFNPKPNAFNDTLLQCDEDTLTDGLTIFNLTEAQDVLTGGIPNRSVKFYRDIARTDILLNTNAYPNVSNPQTIYVDVIDDTTGCSTNAELTIAVSTTEAKNTALVKCDNDDLEDGYYEFNLLEANSEILNGLPLDLSVTYYETYENALLEKDNLGTIYTNTVPDSQTIYARIERANSCYGISEVSLKVNPLPNIITEESTFYCLNNFPSTITINAGILNDSPSNYSYQWSNGSGNYEIQINEPKTYTVIVTNTNGCSKTRTINVETSNIATFNTPAFQIKDNAQNNSITVSVSGEGTYEFALYDDANIILITPFQESNIFNNVSPGIYTVRVQDLKNNCGTITQNVSVLGFPKVFTPNNDGFNDTWQVIGVSSMFNPDAKILIFNRYGKLVKQLNPLGPGWNGLFNGSKLPSDDYWFSITLQDGRVIKNHFALKN